MKPLLFLLILFGIINVAAQQVVVANQEQNIVYCGIDNRLSALAGGYPCQSVILTTDNGKINKVSCGTFIYHPAKQGPSIITVWVKNRNRLKKIGEVPYRAHQLPSVALVGSYMGGKISAKVFRAMGGVRAYINCCGFDAPLQVASFTITLIRDKKPVFWLDNIGSRFSNEITDSLQNLVADDIIFITAIKVTMPNGETEEVSFLKFIVSD